MADTKKYKVLNPVKLGGKLIAAGKTIELSEKQAAAMPWAVEPVKAEAKPEPKSEAKPAAKPEEKD